MITRAETAGAVQRLAAMQETLVACAADPTRLLQEMVKILEILERSEALQGRSGDAKFYGELALYASKLQEGVMVVLAGGKGPA